MIDWSLLAVFIAVLVGVIFNNQRVGSLHREIDMLRTSMDRQIDMLRTSLLAEMAAMKREILAEIKTLDTRVAALEREMHGTR
jgi:phage host-nuclease inhibitor protein Gam